MIKVAAVKNPYSPLTQERHEYGSTMTIAEALARHPMPEHLPFVCMVNEQYVLRSEDWDTFVIPEEAVCSFISIPQGGGGGQKNPLATILTLVVLAAVSYGTAALFAPAAGTASAGLLANAGWAVKATVTLASGLFVAGASYLINMALPPSFAKPPDTPDPAYSIVGRSNQALLGAPQEVGYGRLQFYPSLCAAPYSEYSESFSTEVFEQGGVGDQTLYEIYMGGWGYYDIEAYDLTNQDTENFPEVVIQKFEPGEQITSFPSSVVTVPAVSNVPLPFSLTAGDRTGVIAIATIQDGSIYVTEIQRLTLRGWASGQFKVIHEGVESPYIAYNATAAVVQAALETLPGLAGNVRCEGGPLNSIDPELPVTIEFINGMSFRPVNQFTLAATDELVSDEGTYPKWDSILHWEEDTIVSWGYNDTQAWMTVDNPQFPVGQLVGKHLSFQEYRPALHHADYSTYGHRPGGFWAVIAANDATTIWWDVPPQPTMLRRTDADNTPIRPRLVSDGTSGGQVIYQVVDIGNWVGPYKINPDESSDLIGQIAVDFSLPFGLHVGGGTKAYAWAVVSWNIEYQEIDNNGVPLDAQRWHSLTRDPRYFAGGMTIPDPIVSRYSTVTVATLSVSPIRFSVRGTVPAGRYQIRLASTRFTQYATHDAVSDPATDPAFSLPGGYPATWKNLKGWRELVNDAEDNENNVAMQSFVTGLRGYGVSEVLRWDERTIFTLRMTATENVNEQTLQQFAVTATRRLQDYYGDIDGGALPLNPLTTVVLAGVQTLPPSSLSAGVAAESRYSTVAVENIGDYFDVNDYVRLSGYTGDDAANNGEWRVARKSQNSLVVQGTLTGVEAQPTYVAGSRRVYSTAPTILSGVAITDSETIELTGIGLLPEFAVGSKVTLKGFADAANTGKFDIVGVTSDTLFVDATLVPAVASSGQTAHSAPPYGLVGVAMDGTRLTLSGATSLGGIDAASLNSVVFTGAGISVDNDGVSLVTGTGIGLLAQAVVGARVTLGGFTEKRNQDTVEIIQVNEDSLRVAVPRQHTRDPVPQRSPLRTEAAGPSTQAIFGAREMHRDGDTSFWFYADQGATDVASGGGTITYDVPNQWTDLRASRRISSAVYDLATDSFYGGGADPTRVDLEGLRSLERTWEARDRYEVNGIDWKDDPVPDRYDARLSERKRLTDVFQEIARCGRARAVYPSGVVTLVRDEPRPVADSMVTGRNILQGSLDFIATFPTEDTPDYVLAQFFNEEFWDYDEVVCTLAPYSLSQRLRLRYATSGTYTLTLDNEETAAIQWNADAAAIQAALELLPSVPAGALLCTGPSPVDGEMTVTYAGDWLGRNVSLIEADSRNLVGGAVRIVYDINPAWPGVAPARLVMPGITQRKQAWREGMYELGSSRARRMLVTYGTDVEGYIPSYLSRVDLTHEIGNWGQHGLVVDYIITEPTSYVVCSEPLNWDTDGNPNVIQLRDKMGKPVTDGLHYVTQGPYPNYAHIDGVLDVEGLGLHTDHQVGREATFFSFGLPDAHALKLLVTGLRPTGRDAVNIEGYIYQVEGVYDIDNDLEYVPPDEATVLDARQVGGEVRNLAATLTYVNNFTDYFPQVSASWTRTPWAKHYLLEYSMDDGVSWTTIQKVTENKAQFTPEAFVLRDVNLAEGFTCGLMIDPLVTVIARRPASEPTPWVVGAYNNTYIAFQSGVYAGERFRIAQSLADGLFLADKLTPRPAINVDTYNIVDTTYGSMLLGVRGFNGVYGPRATVEIELFAADGTHGTQVPSQLFIGSAITIPASSTTPQSSVFTEQFRIDYYGNVFYSGKMFDMDHITRHCILGSEPRHDNSDMTLAYLPSEPRRFVDGVDLGYDALLVFLQDSLLTQVASAPGEGEFMRSGLTLTLGFERNPQDRIHILMISANDDSQSLAAIRIGEPVPFTAGTTSATLPFSPANPDEVLLVLNGDFVYPVDSAPGPGEFTLIGTAVTAGFTFESGDSLRALGLAADYTTEAGRFHCAPFAGDALPHVPLYPAQCCIIESGTVRWNATGEGNYQIDPLYSPPVSIIWGRPTPDAELTKYAILLRANA